MEPLSFCQKVDMDFPVDDRKLYRIYSARYCDSDFILTVDKTLVVWGFFGRGFSSLSFFRWQVHFGRCRKGFFFRQTRLHVFRYGSVWFASFFRSLPYDTSSQGVQADVCQPSRSRRMPFSHTYKNLSPPKNDVIWQVPVFSTVFTASFWTLRMPSWKNWKRRTTMESQRHLTTIVTEGDHRCFRMGGDRSWVISSWKPHRWKLFGGFVTRETFFGGLVLTRSQVFSLMFGRDRMQPAARKICWAGVFGRTSLDLCDVQIYCLSIISYPLRRGCLHQLPPPEDGYDHRKRWPGRIHLKWFFRGLSRKMQDSHHSHGFFYGPANGP